MPQRVIANCDLKIAHNVRRNALHFLFCRLHIAVCAAAICLSALGVASAQDVVMPAPAGMDNGAPPVTQYGGGSFFSQDLGTMLRLRYNTESYGQYGRGNFDVGTMQVWSLDGSAAFVDGQVTLNELQGVGYNLGVGYRWLHNSNMSQDAGRLAGVSLWSDGTSTDEGNFFPQIGLSLESLGDMWDFRANGYLPLGSQDQQGDFVATGQTGFQGNSIAELTQAVLNTSYAVAEAEAARRLGSERDAWAFAGPYFVGNDDDDAVGYRLGVRGYAYPDLLLQVAVSDDEIFNTNATFSVTWFVGRTRTDFQPACGVPDRLREPVMRNDYVALSQSFVTGGTALTNPDGTALRIVHVDSDAAPGGDGTFENPYDNLPDVNGAGSLEGDIILAHALSVFDGEVSTELKDNQRLLGEGNGVEHTVATAEAGTIIIPETFAGARDAARPMILSAIGDAIILADANEVNNFTIDGEGVTNSAIVSPAAGSGNPILRNLAISNTVDDGIRLTPLTIVDTDDVDNDGNVTETIVRGNVTIADVVFNNIGADDIDIDAFTSTNIALPNTTLQEVISITNVTSTNNNGRSIAIANTHSGAGRTATINNFTYNGGANSLGGIVLTNFDSTFNASNSTLTGGNILGAGAQILGDSDGTMTFANTVVFNDVTGTAVDINGDDAGTDALGGTITVNGPITTNVTGRSVSVQNVATPANIDFNGNITDDASGILVNSNSGGTITFATGTIDLDIDTPGANAITVTNNTGATVEFTGPVDIDATSTANGLVATGGGTLRYSNTANTIDTVSGQVIRVQNMTIATQGVNVSTINRTTAAATSAVQLEDNTGGPIVLGDVTDTTPGDSGTLQGGAADTVVINDSANVTISNVIINNLAAFSGVRVEKTTAGVQTVNLNDLIVNDGDRGVEVIGGAGAGALNMTINDTQLLDSTDIGLSFDNVDTGTMDFNNLDIDGNNVGAAGRGVVISDSNASFDFDAASEIREFDSTDFEVNNGSGTTSAGTITFAGDIINATTVNPGDTSGRSVHIHEVTGGSINFTAASSINDDNEGMLVEDNTGGTISFLGDNDFNTGANDAVTIDNNTGATISLSNLNIDTTTGDGFTATNGGTLTVTGAANTIDTVDGVGLRIEDMTIGGTGVAFQTVNVTSGDTNAIVLQDLIGTGQVTVGTIAGPTSMLTTVGDAIVLTNVVNADFNNVQVVNATAIASEAVNIDHTNAATTAMDITFNNLTVTAAGDLGIEVDAASTQTFNLRVNNSTLAESVVMDNTGSGAFRVLLDSTDITTTGTNEALQITLGGSTVDADVTVQNGSNLVAANARAFDLAVTGAGPNLELELDASTFTNNSASETVNILNNNGAVTNANITNNTITNNGAGDDAVITSDGSATTRINLNLVNNGPVSSTIELVTANNGGGFNFGVVDRDTANANNPANVTFFPLITDFEDIDGPVELPNGP